MWSDTSTTSARPPRSQNIISALSTASPQVLTVFAPRDVSPHANKTHCDERQPIVTERRTERLASVPRASSRSRYIGLIRSLAKENGLPVDVADAVAYVESGYDPEKIGSVGEIGLMQVRPSTASMLGFRGSGTELAAPETNIQYGVTYLARAWRLAEGDLCRALMKYRAGHGEEEMTARSVEYCGRANAYLERINSSLAMNFLSRDLQSPISFGSYNGAAAKRNPVTIHPKKSRDSNRFWAAHEARIRLLTQRVHAKWRNIAQSPRASAL